MSDLERKTTTRLFWPNCLMICGLLLVLLGVGIEIFGSGHRAWLGIFAGSLLLFFGNLKNMKTLKLSPTKVEIETREIAQRAQENAEEAKATLEQLRSLAVTMSKAQLSLLHRQGRYGGGYSTETKEQFQNEIIKHLEHLSVSPNQIRNVLKDPNKCIEFDYAQLCKTAIKSTCNLTKGQMATLMEMPPKEGIDGEVSSPEKLLAFMENLNCENEQAKELIEDYSYFKATKSHRRPEVWLNSRQISQDLHEQFKRKSTIKPK